MTGTMEHPQLQTYSDSRYVEKARRDAETLRFLRARVDREPVWATVVPIDSIRRLLDMPPQGDR